MRNFRTFFENEFPERRGAGMRLVRRKPSAREANARAGRLCQQRKASPSVLKISFEKESIVEVPIQLKGGGKHVAAGCFDKMLRGIVGKAGRRRQDAKSCRWCGLILVIAIAAGFALLFTGCNFAPRYK